MNLYKALTMDITNKLPLRLRAAGWTAAVAALPAYAFAWFIAGPSGLGEFMRLASLSNAPVLTGMALVAAGISGYLLCWRLFDRERYHHGWRAAGIGVAACLLAYFLLGCILVAASVPELTGNLAKEPFPEDWNLVLAAWNLVVATWNLVLAVFGLFGAGLYLTGWFMVPLAALAAFVISVLNRPFDLKRRG